MAARERTLEKLGATVAVLKKAYLEEKERREQSEEAGRTKDDQIQSLMNKTESLAFNNHRLKARCSKLLEQVNREGQKPQASWVGNIFNFSQGEEGAHRVLQEELQVKIQENEALHRSIETQREEHRKTIVVLQKKLCALKANLESTQLRNQTLEHEKQTLEQHMHEQRLSGENAVTQIQESHQTEVRGLQSQCDTLLQEKHYLEKRVSRLEKSLASVSSFESNNNRNWIEYDVRSTKVAAKEEKMLFLSSCERLIRSLPDSLETLIQTLSLLTGSNIKQKRVRSIIAHIHEAMEALHGIFKQMQTDEQSAFVSSSASPLVNSFCSSLHSLCNGLAEVFARILETMQENQDDIDLASHGPLLEACRELQSMLYQSMLDINGSLHSKPQISWDRSSSLVDNMDTDALVHTFSQLRHACSTLLTAVAHAYKGQECAQDAIFSINEVCSFVSGVYTQLSSFPRFEVYSGHADAVRLRVEIQAQQQLNCLSMVDLPSSIPYHEARVSETEVQELRDRFNAAHLRAIQLEGEVSQDQHEMDALRAAMSRTTAQVEILVAEKAELESTVRQAEAKVEASTARIATMQRELEKKHVAQQENHNGTTMQLFDSAMSAVALEEAQQSLCIIEGDLLRVQAQLDRRSESFFDLKRTLQKREQELQDTMADLHMARSSLQEMAYRLEESEETNEKMAQQLTEQICLLTEKLATQDASAH